MSSEKTVPLILIKTVLFPGIALVQEFEGNEDRQAIKGCYERQVPLGIVLQKGGITCDVGCLALVQDLLEGEHDGSLRAMLKGEDRFKIVDWLQKGDAPIVAYEEIRDLEQEIGEDEMKTLQREVLASYKEIVLIVKPERFVQVADAKNQTGMAFPLAASTVFDVGVKQNILEDKTEHGRLRTLTVYYREILPRIRALGGNGFLLSDD